MGGGDKRWLLIAAALALPDVASANLTDPSRAPTLPADDPGLGGPLRGAGGAMPELPPEPPQSPQGPGSIPLFPRLPMAPAAGWILDPEPSPSSREEEAEAALDRYFDEQLMRDRFEAGDVDGWYHGVGRSMRERFRPDRDALERERHAGMTVLQRVWDELRRQGRPRERPQDVPGQTLPEQRAAVRDPTDRAAASEQELWDLCNVLNAPVTWYTVVLRVTHNPEGELSAVWVHRSSGYASLDRAALQAARAGAISVDPPPSAVVEERQAIRSDWAFDLGDVATFISCLPHGVGAEVACVDDPIQGTMCAFAGRGIVRTRVRLLEVVDATHLTPAERRAARRRDPDRPRP